MMAGYQRHKFETTNVAPGSDGGWGAFARGFSNGHSIGKAVTSAINQHNISEANKEYEKGMEDLKANQAAVPLPEGQASSEGRSATGLKGLDEKFGDKTMGEADAGFKGTQYENMTAREYFSQNHKKDFDKESAALKEKRDASIKDSFLRWEGDQAYRQYQAEDMAERNARLDLNNKEARQKVVDSYNRPDWYNQEGALDRINNAATYIGAVTGQNIGKFAVKDGKLMNDTGKGFVELPPQALSMVKRAAMADQIWDATGNGADFSNVWKAIGDQEKIGNDKQRLAIDMTKAQAAKAYYSSRGTGGSAGKDPTAMGPMKDSDYLKLLEMEFKPVIDEAGNEFMVSPDGGAVKIPTRRLYRTNKPSQKNYAPRKEAIPTTPRKVPEKNSDK